ncbi:Uncharacterised protein [uncultured archaeon]|nr:Uncharacterised protein [uncultured archaeon]
MGDDSSDASAFRPGENASTIIAKSIDNEMEIVTSHLRLFILPYILYDSDRSIQYLNFSLCISIISRARYSHQISAKRGIAAQCQDHIFEEGFMASLLEEDKPRRSAKKPPFQITIF